MREPDLRVMATELQQAALEAVEPGAAVHRHVHREEDVLIVASHRYDLHDYERVFVVGCGKATVPMTTAIVDILGERLTQGVIVTKYGHTTSIQHPASSIQYPVFSIQIIEAGHPVPDENSMRGAQAVADLARRATERDLVICLISGGGSALLTLPVPGLSLADLQALTDALLRSGATINELNTVRKHWSRIKGGNLARLVAPATLVTLILSDVVGDQLDVIASGPTVPDPTTVADAQAVLERYGIRPPSYPPSRGEERPPSYPPSSGEGILQETPKPGDPAFERVQHVVVGSNRLAALAAVGRARQLGFNALLLSTYVEGEAREVARVAAALAKSVRAHGDPLPPPACLVWGGETTVTIRGEGRGGRNQELALAAALALDGWPGVLVMALATDGTDGPTDAAGAVVTGETVARAQALGLNPRAALEANDSYPFFDALGDLIRTGPTGTNVNDLLFALAGSERRDCGASGTSTVTVLPVAPGR
jgi:glycerate 2-kinase